ncbi:hypothetical protein IAQ61_003945 [Plenodomus lingam]|uniref:uncharacterized protein n=1 Tax=Leptosphaeria maculans TaxID=5022 RepID=UPI00331E1236|nr:hypothetical protein IAQ61_003945 [Plenodomus lingam]
MNTAIKNLTLTNPAAVIELQRRRANFCADTSILPSIRTRGLLMLDDVLRVHVPTALNEGQSVAPLLRRVIRTLGAFYQENQERLTANEDFIMQEEQGSSEKASELLQEDKDEDDDMLDVKAHQSEPSSARMSLETRLTKARATLDNRAAVKQKRQRAALAMRVKAAEQRKQRQIDLVDTNKPLLLQQTASLAATNELITATTPSLLPSENQPTVATSPLTAPTHTRCLRGRVLHKGGGRNGV